MSLSDGDRAWMEGRFQLSTKAMDELRKEFGDHLTRDELTSHALREHIRHCEDSKTKRQKDWRFYLGIVISIAGSVVALIIEKWLFAQKVKELFPPK